MAVQADKNPPESRNFSERIVDFSGGLNTTISGSLLNSNEAQVATDISMEQKGTIRPRKGRIKRYPTPFDASPITGLGVYYKNDGTSRLLMSANESLYSDAPHMSTRWDTKAEWEQAGILLDGLASVTEVEGSVTCRKQAFGDAALTSDATLWTAIDAIISVKTADSHYNEGNSLEVLINTGKTAGYAYKLASTLDTSKYVVVTAYVKNLDVATGIRVVGLSATKAVTKGSAYVTGTGWTQIILKLTPTEVQNITSFGVNVTGTAGQMAYFCGLFYEYITEADYNNAGFIPHELYYFNPYRKDFTFNSLETFGTGTYNHTAVTGDVLGLAVEFAAATISKTTQSDFSTGILQNTSITELVDSVSLARQA